jgi:hypothetical protein
MGFGKRDKGITEPSVPIQQSEGHRTAVIEEGAMLIQSQEIGTGRSHILHFGTVGSDKLVVI